MIDVTQADRDAAAKSHRFIYWESLHDHFGERTATHITQAFARHRIAAHAEGYAAAKAQAVGVLVAERDDVTLAPILRQRSAYLIQAIASMEPGA